MYLSQLTPPIPTLLGCSIQWVTTGAQGIQIIMPIFFGVAVSTSSLPNLSSESILEHSHHCLWLYFIFIYFTPKSVAQAWPSHSASHSNCSFYVFIIHPVIFLGSTKTKPNSMLPLNLLFLSLTCQPYDYLSVILSDFHLNFRHPF